MNGLLAYLLLALIWFSAIHSLAVGGHAHAGTQIRGHIEFSK